MCIKYFYMAQNVMNLSFFSLVVVTIIKSVRFNMQKEK